MSKNIQLWMIAHLKGSWNQWRRDGQPMQIKEQVDVPVTVKIVSLNPAQLRVGFVAALLNPTYRLAVFR